LKEEFDASNTRYYHGSPYPNLVWGAAPDEAGWATEGYGIYLTPDIEQAKGYAVKEERDGYLYTLEIPSGMNIIDFHGPIPDYVKSKVEKIPDFYKFFKTTLLDNFNFDEGYIEFEDMVYSWDGFGDDLPQWAIEDGHKPNTYFILDEKTQKEVAKNLKGEEDILKFFKNINKIGYKEYIYLSDINPNVDDYFSSTGDKYGGDFQRLYLEDLKTDFDALYFYIAAHLNSLKKATMFFVKLGIDGVYTTKWSRQSSYFINIFKANKLNVINKQLIKYDKKYKMN